MPLPKRKKHRLYHYSMHSTSILLVVPLIQELFPSLTENLIGVNSETRKLMGATRVWSMVGVDTNNRLWNKDNLFLFPCVFVDTLDYHMIAETKLDETETDFWTRQR